MARAKTECTECGTKTASHDLGCSVNDVPHATSPVITSFKGLDSQFQCRGFQFEIGQTYTVSGKIKACENGFHACPDHPFDVWEYYPPTGEDGSMTRYALVEQSGATSREGTKLASASITFKAEISLPEFIKRGVEYILAQVDWKDAKETNTGDQSAATNTGDRSAATVDGSHSVAVSVGIEGRAKASATSGTVLAYRSPDNGDLIHLFAARVGEYGIKADTWYMLNPSGEPIEAA